MTVANIIIPIIGLAIVLAVTRHSRKGGPTMPEPDKVTVELTVPQAAEVHTHCDMAAREYLTLSRKTRALPLLASMFEEAAWENAVIADKLEQQVPAFKEGATRGDMPVTQRKHDKPKCQVCLDKGVLDGPVYMSCPNPTCEASGNIPTTHGEEAQ